MNSVDGASGSRQQQPGPIVSENKQTTKKKKRGRLKQNCFPAFVANSGGD